MIRRQSIVATLTSLVLAAGVSAGTLSSTSVSAPPATILPASVPANMAELPLLPPDPEVAAKDLARDLEQAGLPTAPDNPDAIAEASAIQATPPWGLDRIDQPYQPLDKSYRYETSGKGITVFVLDSGITPLAEFGARLKPGATFVADARGTSDCSGHGTHVAGIIGSGTYGVAKDVDLVPVRVLGCDGRAPLSQITKGVEWIIANRPAGPFVVNMSLGGSADLGMENAVQRLINAGATVVASAGNKGVDARVNSPSRIPAVISVGAVGATSGKDVRAGFSNFGSTVDLYAPGVNILSTDAFNGTSVKMGTSMASPHVAGLAARHLEVAKGSAAQVTTALMAATVPITIDKGEVRFSQASAASNTAPVTTVPPGAPTTTIPQTTTTAASSGCTLHADEFVYNGWVYKKASGQIVRQYVCGTTTSSTVAPTTTAAPTTTVAPTTSTTKAPVTTSTTVRVTTTTSTTKPPAPTTTAPVVATGLAEWEFVYANYVYDGRVGQVVRKWDGNPTRINTTLQLTIYEYVRNGAIYDSRTGRIVRKL